MRTSLSIWRLVRVAGDLVAGVAAMALAFYVRLNLPVPLTTSLLPSDRVVYLLTALSLVAVSQNAILYFFGFYELPHPRQRAERLRRLVFSTFFQGFCFAGYFFLMERRFPRSVLLLYVAFNLFLLFVSRLLMDRTLRPPAQRAIVVGANATAVELAKDVDTYHWHGLSIVGYVTPPHEAGLRAPEPALGKCLGTTEDLPRLLDENDADEVILASTSTTWETALFDQLAQNADRRPNILLLPTPFESLVGRMRYRSIHDVPLIEVVRQSEWTSRRPLKRAIDLVLAGLMLLLALPVIGICAVAIRSTSEGPVFYSQTRLGRDRRPFKIWKLRTMRNDAETSQQEIMARRDDPRITPIGSWLRNLRLDELPQLVNVLGGSMSLVGPRPERPGFVAQYLEEVPGYAGRFAVQPGLTGLAQVNGDYDSSPENKLRYDLAYLANWSIWLDVTILLRTVKIVLTSRGT
ncbi:MAG: sugar transferase [Acidobacteriota bacterium]